MRGLFIRPLGACNIAPFEFKRDPAVIGAIITAAGALASTATSSIAQSNLNADNRDFSREMTEQQNAFNREEAEKARLHQSSLLSAEQNWNEYMYNQYQSPSALRRQYEEAGYNPYLVEGSGHVGGSVPTGPTAPSTAQALGSNPLNPQTQAPNFSAFGSGLSDAAHMYFNAKQATANTANVNAMALKNIAEAANYLIESGYSEKEVQKVIEPYFKSSQGMNMDSNMFVQGMFLSNQEKQIKNDWNQLLFEIDKEFGRTERADKVMNMEQQFSVLAAEIGRMAVQNKLDEAVVERISSEIVRNIAAAGLDNANATLIWKSMQFMIQQAKYEAQISKYGAKSAKGEYGLREPIYDAASTDAGQTAEVIDYYGNKIFDKVGKIGKINIGYTNGNYRSNTYFESQNKNWNVRSNFDYKHGITAP